MVTFQQAYDTAIARCPRDEWDGLSPALRIKAIYEEMRRLDAETAAAMVDAHTIHGKEHPSQIQLRRADQEQAQHAGDRGMQRRGEQPNRDGTQQRQPPVSRAINSDADAEEGGASQGQVN